MAQRVTANAELGGTVVSLTICTVFFVLYFFIRRTSFECCRRCYGWDRSTDHYLAIAILAMLQGVTFLVSAGSNPAFQPLAMSNTTCRAQGIVFQWATAGLLMAVVVEMTDIYLVLVKNVPKEEIRKRYTPWLIVLVIVVATLFTGVPLTLEATTGSLSWTWVVLLRAACVTMLQLTAS